MITCGIFGVDHQIPMPLPTGIGSSSVHDGELLTLDHNDSSDGDDSGKLFHCFRYFMFE